MDSAQSNIEMSRLLRSETTRLVSRHKSKASRSLSEFVSLLREAEIGAVLFGGVARSLLLSRIMHKTPGTPRDIDVVITGVNFELLAAELRPYVRRETRFGGLKIRKEHWEIDIWPLNRTWAFDVDRQDCVSAHLLPTTTFLNIEAIAIDAWVQRGHRRQIYCESGQFFDAIRTRTLEINREHNACPELNVVRALILAATTEFLIGPHLARYASSIGAGITSAEWERLQRDHYGHVRWSGREVVTWIEWIRKRVAENPTETIALPRYRQSRLFESASANGSVRVHALAS